VAEDQPPLSPTCVRITGYIYEGLDQAQAQAGFAAFVEQISGEILDQTPEMALAHAPAADTAYEIYPKLLLGHDYCLLQVWVTPVADDLRAPFDTVLALAQGLPDMLPVPPLFQMVLLTCQDRLPEEAVRAFFDDGVFTRSLIYVRRLMLNLEGPRGLLFPVEPVPDALISRAVDDVAQAYLFYHKVLSFYEAYPRVYAQVNEIEERVCQRMEEATIRPMGEWLNEVADRYVDLANITRGLRQDLYSMNANVNNLSGVARRWWEQRVGDYPMCSSPLLDQARAVIRAHDALSERVDAVRTRLDDVVTMVRTRSEVNRLKMTNFIQFVTAAFGMSGVANQLFGGLRDLGVLPAALSPTLLTVLFIPVAILLAWLLTRWMSRRR
jgi:hypothetical protein